MTAPRKRPPPRLVAIAGGKGGVGKSTVAANLALMIGRLGMRVALVDADLGAANLHTMLGMLRPESGLADFLDRRIDTLDEARLTMDVPTVSLIPGTSRPGAANMTQQQKLRLIRAIARLDADCVIVDVGAGTSYNVVDFVAAADLKLFVVTAQLPSLHNAYALLKACVHRVVRKMAEGETEQTLIDSALGNEGKARTIPQLLGVLRQFDANLADRIVDVLLRFGVGLIGNQVGDADAPVLGRMTTMIYDHLLIQAPVMATVARSSALAGGLKAGAGVRAKSTDDAFAIFRQLANTVIEADLDRLRGTQRAMNRTMPLWMIRDELAAAGRE